MLKGFLLYLTNVNLLEAKKKKDEKKRCECQLCKIYTRSQVVVQKRILLVSEDDKIINF